MPRPRTAAERVARTELRADTAVLTRVAIFYLLFPVTPDRVGFHVYARPVSWLADQTLAPPSRVAPVACGAGFPLTVAGAAGALDILTPFPIHSDALRHKNRAYSLLPVRHFSGQADSRRDAHFFRRMVNLVPTYNLRRERSADIAAVLDLFQVSGAVA